MPLAASRLHRSLRRVLIPTVLAAAIPALMAPAAQASTQWNVTLQGHQTFIACPAGSPANAVCLEDTVFGTLDTGRTGTTTVDGSFTVVIDVAKTDATGTAPVTKKGTLRDGLGHLFQLTATGTTRNYDTYYTVTIKALGYSDKGSGTWHVPPPTSATATSSDGPEYIVATLN